MKDMPWKGNTATTMSKRWPTSYEHNAKLTKDFQITATPSKRFAGQVLERPYVYSTFKVQRLDHLLMSNKVFWLQKYYVGLIAIKLPRFLYCKQGRGDNTTPASVDHTWMHAHFMSLLQSDGNAQLHSTLIAARIFCSHGSKIISETELI